MTGLDPPARERLVSFASRFGIDEDSLSCIWQDTDSPDATIERPTSIYLDLNHWIALAKARLGRSDGTVFRPCYESLKTGVREGRLVVPLAAAHYMELANIADVSRRTHIANVMSELSRFRTIADRKPRLRAEFEAALHSRLGRPMFPYKCEAIGFGAHFAFGHADRDSGTTILREMAREGSVGAAMLDETDLGWAINTLSEFVVLRGPRAADVARMPDYNLAKAQSITNELAQREQELARLLKEDPSHRSRLDDIVRARVLYWELSRDLPELLTRAGMSVDAFYAKRKDWITNFLEDLPLTAVQIALTTQALRNASRPWTENDVYDIDALAAAVPYCDIVVTEKYACDVLNRTGLAKRLQTTVLRSLSDLEKAISYN